MWLVYLGLMFVIVNSVVNFVIYLVFDKSMWNEFKWMLFICCKKWDMLEEDGVWSWWISLNMVMWNNMIIRISDEVVNKIIDKDMKEMNGNNLLRK